MDYSAIYARLIKRAENRSLNGYSERHHVIPRCLGGSDDLSNIVRLTPEEHYVAHQLLVKMNQGHAGLLWAAIAMTSGGSTDRRSGNKLYGWLKQEFARRQTGSKRWSNEVKSRIGAASKKRNQGENHPMYGRKHSPETLAKLSAVRKGMPSPRKGAKLSEATREKLRSAQLAFQAKRRSQ